MKSRRFCEGASHAPPDIAAALERLGLVPRGETPWVTPLTGGVASDIMRVDVGERSFCIKRALGRLKVAAEWTAPVERRHYEVEWFRIVGRIVPGSVPEIIGDDAKAGLFALTWFDPSEYSLWKNMLARGVARRGDAVSIAGVLATIHAATANEPSIARRFKSDDIFHAIRLEPYLEATAAAHPDLAPVLKHLVARTAGTRRALVHGDVSPKNIFIGPEGPVLLDAECAWYGDPAFDVAFCLNHLLLKCLWVPEAADDFLACFDALAATYLERAVWEPREALEARIATLLPGLFLARVDGKSPVEYITEDEQRARVRRVARRFLSTPCDRLDEIARAWREELSA